jgi:alpha-amylase
MGEWCLPPNLSKRYEATINNNIDSNNTNSKGGYFKHFLIKYPESNDIHKKMLSVSKKAYDNPEARRHVFMAQCNDSYWHGVFGGLYLPHLRSSAFSHLIQAEKLLDPVQPFVMGTIEDVNADGMNEAVISNNFLKAYFCLQEGGTLYELDHKPTSTNIMANLCRRYEAYHDKIPLASVDDVYDGARTIHNMYSAKEGGLEHYLTYDWHRRSSLIDHVMGKDVTWESFYRCQYVEPGDFVKEPYQAILKNDQKTSKLSLLRKGHFWKGGVGLPLTVEKTIQLNRNESTISFDYRIDGNVADNFLFGVEFNFSFLGNGGERYMDFGTGKIPLTAKGIYKSTNKIIFYDPYQDINPAIQFDRSISVWTFPVEVVSLSESGFERNYQSTMCMPMWDIDLTNGPRNIHIELSVDGLGSNNHI